MYSSWNVSRDIANTLAAMNGSYDVVSYLNGTMKVIPRPNPGEEEHGKLLLSALPVPGRPAAGFLIQTTSSAGQLAICTILQFLPLACRVAGIIKIKGRWVRSDRIPLSLVKSSTWDRLFCLVNATGTLLVVFWFLVRTFNGPKIVASSVFFSA